MLCAGDHFMNAVRRIGFISAAIVGLALSLFLAFAFIMAFGGIKGVLMELKPRPNLGSDAVMNGRTQLAAEIESQFAHVIEKSDFTVYETSSDDICDKGLHFLKFNDKYAHRCRLLLTRFYGFNGAFRSEQAEFAQRALAAGWKCADSRGPGVVMSDASCHEWKHDDGPVKLAMRINYSQSARPDFFGLDVVQKIYFVEHGPVFFQNKDFHNPAQVARRVAQSHQYILAIGIRGRYFED
jgi:hypothetical protein